MYYIQETINIYTLTSWGITWKLWQNKYIIRTNNFFIHVISIRGWWPLSTTSSLEGKVEETINLHINILNRLPKMRLRKGYSKICYTHGTLVLVSSRNVMRFLCILRLRYLSQFRCQLFPRSQLELLSQKGCYLLWSSELFWEISFEWHWHNGFRNAVSVVQYPCAYNGKF